MATKKASTTPAKKTAAKAAATPAEETKPAVKKAAAKKAPAKTVAAKDSVVTSENTKKAATHAEIADRAHSLWEQRGRHHGGHHDDWFRAEKELNG